MLKCNFIFFFTFNDIVTVVSVINKTTTKFNVNNFINNLVIESVSSGKITSIDDVTTNSDGKIISVNRASVSLSNGSVVSNLYNASGEILNIGDMVKIFGSRTNMSNRYIGIKYESEV